MRMDILQYLSLNWALVTRRISIFVFGLLLTCTILNSGVQGQINSDSTMFKWKFGASISETFHLTRADNTVDVSHSIQSASYTGVQIEASRRIANRQYVNISLGYESLRVKQRLFYDLFVGLNNEVNLTHNVDFMQGSISYDASLINNPFSNLCIGVEAIGLIPLTKEVQTNSVQVKDSQDFYNSYAFMRPSSKLMVGFRVYLKSGIRIGNFNLIEIQPYAGFTEWGKTRYTYSAENWFDSNGEFYMNGLQAGLRLSYRFLR